jgi:hypothetical protein
MGDRSSVVPENRANPAIAAYGAVAASRPDPAGRVPAVRAACEEIL